ncbi:hypothetical protein [Novosphingobium sp. SG707]|uniref:hypothetical protein n=1 Tax=Novosphingobium sp. SG707 TaxID=2586996 RepID=UPI0014459A24|nr:hypothetical protein [Novosphingobium sp. SG707]NKI99969.1 hypothetical protein [Novosphingobium sp. SG707]
MSDLTRFLVSFRDDELEDNGLNASLVKCRQHHVEAAPISSFPQKQAHFRDARTSL